MARKYAKKNNKMKKRGGRKPRVVYRNKPLGPLFPQEQIAKHRFSATVDLVCDYTSADQLTTNSFRFISPYTLHNPLAGPEGVGPVMFYDQMKAHYQKYQVLGAKVRVKFINKSSAPVFIGIFRNTTTPTSGWKLTSIRERGFKKQKMLGALNTGREVGNMTETYSLKKALGQNKLQIEANSSTYMTIDDDTVNQDAVTQFIVFYAAPVDSTLNPSTNLPVECQIDYQCIARWMDRDRLGDSESA